MANPIQKTEYYRRIVQIKRVWILNRAARFLKMLCAGSQQIVHKETGTHRTVTKASATRDWLMQINLTDVCDWLHEYSWVRPPVIFPTPRLLTFLGIACSTHNKQTTIANCWLTDPSKHLDVSCWGTNRSVCCHIVICSRQKYSNWIFRV